MRIISYDAAIKKDDVAILKKGAKDEIDNKLPLTSIINLLVNFIVFLSGTTPHNSNFTISVLPAKNSERRGRSFSVYQAGTSSDIAEEVGSEDGNIPCSSKIALIASTTLVSLNSSSVNPPSSII